MKYTILLAFSVLLTFTTPPALAQVSDQPVILLDTIYANEHKNVALFFPEPIRQGITGSDNFVFTYNREKEQYFGLLQAKPGRESNLLIINTDGSVFSYIVRYSERLTKLNYFIPESNKIGKEKPVKTLGKTLVDTANVIADKSPYYAQFSSYLLQKKQKICRIRKQEQGIVLSIENIVFDKEELYFVIQIENRSALDYDLNFLNLSVETRKKGKKKSLQTLYREPIYKYNVPSEIAKNETVKMVYVLPKFSISDDRRAVLDLNEKNGERNIKLKISHRYINNPN